jgi:ankyrin repeat protein
MTEYVHGNRTIESYIGSNGGELDISLHRAAARGDIAEITRLLDAGSDINARDAGESTALHYAVTTNNATAIRLLLLRGADPNLRYAEGSDGLEGDDAVLCAARENKIDAMQELIACGVRVHSHALAFGASGEHMGMVRLLVEDPKAYYADISKRQAIEETFPTAVHTWSLEMVRYFMEKLGYNGTPVDDTSQAVLNAAILAVFNQDDVHDGLDQTEPNPAHGWSSAMQIIKFLVEAGADVNTCAEYIPRTPLHFALQQENLRTELVEYLRDHGANVNIPDWLGRTAVFALLTHPSATETLIEKFKSVGGNFEVRDVDENTPLHLVRNADIARWLLASGSDPSAINSRGETPIYEARRCGRTDIVRELLKAGADVTERTD